MEVQSLFTYDLSHLKSSKKVLFVYLLKGRNNDLGIIKKFKGNFLVQSCFYVPKKHADEIEEIFNEWKVKYKRYDVNILNKR